MALIDKASLLMVPSTYEPGTLYNVLPSGNRAPDSTDQNSGYDQTRADFDFDRGSNAAATRVNAAGLIEKYRENVLTESNNFSDSDWVKADTSVTSGQADKDGGTSAWLLSITAAGGFQTLRQTKSVSGVNTISIYAKAGALDWMRISNGVSTTYFDIANGAIGTDNSIGASIESAGNGFFRCSIPFNGAGSYVYIYPATGNGNVSQSTGNIYIQNAQVESGLVATDVLTSGATTAKAGVLVDLPRINYDANGKNGALLLEPSRQNLLPYSEYFGSGSGYIKNSFACLTNQGISPEGLNNASLIYQTAAGDRDFFVTTPTRVDAFSVYAKSAGKDFFVIFSKAGTNPVWYNLSNGTLGTVSSGVQASITPAGNDWYHLKYYNNEAGPYQFFKPIDNNGSAIGTASGTNGALIYGAQLEAGSYPTSYIPNHSGTGGVTRAADSCSVTGASDVIGQTEGTVYLDFVAQTSDGQSQSHFWLGSANSEIGFYGGSSFIFYSSGGVSIQGGSFVTGQRYKVAFAYKANDYVAYINGVQKGTDTSATVPTMSAAYLNSYNNGTEVQKKSINQTALFKERLTNAELATLTTL